MEPPHDHDFDERVYNELNQLRVSLEDIPYQLMDVVKKLDALDGRANDANGGLVNIRGELVELLVSIEANGNRVEGSLEERLQGFTQRLDGMRAELNIASARLEDIRRTAAPLLLVLVIGILAILGTLRHWF